MESEKIVAMIQENTDRTEHLRLAVEELTSLVKGIESGLSEVKAIQLAQVAKNDG